MWYNEDKSKFDKGSYERKAAKALQLAAVTTVKQRIVVPVINAKQMRAWQMCVWQTVRHM